MNSTFALLAIAAFSASITFAAPPPPPDLGIQGPNSLTEARKDIERDLKELDAKLIEVTKKLAAKMKEAEAEDFREAQVAWIAWRDAEARSVAHLYAPTEASSKAILNMAFDTIVSANKIQMTTDRIKHLEGFLASR